MSAKKAKAARTIVRGLVARTPAPKHAARWPWEWVPILGIFIRRRRLRAAAASDALHAAAMKKATNRIKNRLRFISL